MVFPQPGARSVAEAVSSGLGDFSRTRRPFDYRITLSALQCIWRFNL